MLDFHEVTTWAAQQALAAGHERNSSANREMNRMKARTEALEPTPRFFQPLAPKPKPLRSAAHFVSAPVSREVPSSEPKPVSAEATRLSVEEQEIAMRVELA
jgi:hypothetical protein